MDDKTKAVVERLRLCTRHHGEGTPVEHIAADLIETKATRIEELEAQLAEQQSKKARNTDKLINGMEKYKHLYNGAMIQLTESQRRERAAVGDLRGLCWCCACGEKWDKAPSWSNMTTCRYIRERGSLAVGGGKAGKDCRHWKWRGPQEAGEGEHG